MPLMCKDMVELLDAGNSSLVNHSSLSDYAFLYGVFPTAPSVAIYAAHYNMELEVVSECTHVCVCVLNVLFSKVLNVCVVGDVWDGHQHVPVGAHHVRVGVVTDHSLDEGHVTGEGASGREL